eukprot:TRINITY_DN3975_c0_g1_i1.p1 TRINITY_DN3975_c0_g1~~TRINITY_DN3975_c0_g1_i1.p1  ORF type:complete len:515 (-),score=76.23 TRINITY_DN3975_c0_g1_i1:1-1488(-)
MSEHSVNTESYSLQSQGVYHYEGGWPKDVDPAEADHTIRFRKRIEKDEDYVHAINEVGARMEEKVMQNNAINIYEEYFSDAVADHSSEPASARIATSFRDPLSTLRSPTSYSFHPEGDNKVAVAYSIMEFQRGGPDLPLSSFIWDLSNPTEPAQEILPSSPLCCLEYSKNDPHALAGGSYNGLIALWDTRRGAAAVDTSPVERSHHDPVYSLKWLSNKTGAECMTCSTDGTVCWWDIRKLGEPTDRLTIDIGGESRSLGCTSLCYDASQPNRFMVGTEHGSVVSCTRKAKNPSDRIATSYDAHYGPVRSVDRSPFFSKFFLSVGGWSSKIWNEDLVSPVVSTHYSSSYITCGQWSPVRPAVFATCNSDGVFEVRDYLSKPSGPSLSMSIGDTPLTTFKFQNNGASVIIGGKNGLSTVVTLCSGLHELQANEKQGMAQTLERESRREKMLETRGKEARARQKLFNGQPRASDPEQSTDAAVQQATEEFWAAVQAEQ